MKSKIDALRQMGKIGKIMGTPMEIKVEAKLIAKIKPDGRIFILIQPTSTELIEPKEETEQK